MADKKIAKRHTLLNDVKTQLGSFELTDTVVVQGRKYSLATLTVDEDTWANNFASDKNLLTYRVSTRVPKLAAAIKAIDDVPVDQLVTIDESNEDIKEYLMSKDLKRQLQMSEMLLWLAELPSPIIDSLWDTLAGLNKRRSSSWAEIKN